MGPLHRLFGPRPKPPSPLKAELTNLRKNVRRTDQHLAALSKEFWRNGGICCPTCGVPGYGDLLLKQERRAKRIAEIEKKLST